MAASKVIDIFEKRRHTPACCGRRCRGLTGRCPFGKGAVAALVVAAERNLPLPQVQRFGAGAHPQPLAAAAVQPNLLDTRVQVEGGLLCSRGEMACRLRRTRRPVVSQRGGRLWTWRPAGLRGRHVVSQKAACWS
eukprot:365717-Chlamydomonas_euryale.AAC.10